MLVKQWSEFVPKGPYMDQLFKFFSFLRFFPTVIFVIITVTKALARNVYTDFFYSFVVDECFFFVTTKTLNILYLYPFES